MDDCYYYLYSACTKKNCMYRHSAAAKKNLIMCKLWANKKQCRNECPLRHSDYHLRKDRKDIHCYWEDMEGGCQKEFCDFKHRNPEKDEWKMVKIRTLDEIKRKQSEVHNFHDVYTQRHHSPDEAFTTDISGSQLSEGEIQQMNNIGAHYTFKMDDLSDDKVSRKVFSPKNIKIGGKAVQTEHVNSKQDNSPLQLDNKEFTSADIEKELEMIDKALEEEGLDMRKLYEKSMDQSSMYYPKYDLLHQKLLDVLVKSACVSQVIHEIQTGLHCKNCSLFQNRNFNLFIDAISISKHFRLAFMHNKGEEINNQGMGYPCMDNEEGKSKQSTREMGAQDATKGGNGAVEDGSCSSVTFVNRSALSGSVENDMHKKVIQGGKEISDELGDVLEVLIRYLGAQPKRKNIDCFLCTDKEKVLEHPKEIHTLFKLYSALVFCMLEHCACVKYNERLVEDMFNLENYLLDQIAVKELEFMDAYRDEAMDHRREQLIAMGNVFKIDDALHINREEEIESLTYKFYRKVGDARFLSDAEINLICLILYKRKESFRFFRIFKERKLLINYRLAVLFSLRSECMYKPTEIISQNKSRKFEYEDIGTYKLKNLFIRGGVTNTENFFEHMKYKLGLDRVHEVDQEIEYEKELKTFEGIVVTKRADVNSREFKKWFNRENRKHQWMECVRMWVANRRMDKNVVDLSMIDMCCQYKEFENGHFIYEMLEPITNEKVLKDCFVKYCLLCIHALKEGNKKFNDTIVSNLDETFAKMICSGSSQGSGRSANRTIKSETMESYYDLKRCASKKGERSLHADDVSALSIKKGDTVEYGTAMGGLSDFKTEICIDVEEVNSALHQECGALSNREDGSRGESVVDTSIASRSSTESTRSSLVIDVDFIRKWTDRLVLLIKKARRLDRESSVSWDINRSMTEMIINNILYFEKTCRKEVLEVLLCDICINDEMVQLLLKGFYCYCLSCKESSVKTISDCDMVYKFAEHIYKCWKKKKSGLSLFRRKDPRTKQTIYCCMLGVCCETEKVDQFMDVCKDLKGSSTELNGEMINIFKKFHEYKKCNCDFFRNNPNRHYKKHLINHIFKKE